MTSIAAAPDLKTKYAAALDALDAERAEVKRLRAEIDEAYDRSNRFATKEFHTERRARKAEKENERLREVLAPFAGAAESAIGSVGKTTTLGVLGAIAVYFVTWRDFARARAALNPEGGA